MQTRAFLESGFSLLEFMVVVLIIAILSMIAIPNYTQLLMRQERNATLNALKILIELGKTMAFRQNKTITLCVSADGLHCSQGFGRTILVFENDLEETQPKPGSILQIHGPIHYGQVIFNSFGQDHHTLHIQAQGITHNNGSFTYCPKNGDNREADALIINKASRTYRPSLRNSLGILLKQDGLNRATALSCL